MAHVSEGGASPAGHKDPWSSRAGSLDATQVAPACIVALPVAAESVLAFPLMCV